MTKKTLFFVSFLLFFTMLYGCNKEPINQENKQFVGLTIYEKNTPNTDESSDKKINELVKNGFYTGNDYSFTTFEGNSFFDIKVDYSTISGDVITPDSICIYVSANYYQADSINYPLFIYEIYEDENGVLSTELLTQITNMGGLQIINKTLETTKNSFNYVFTYRISIQKTNNPVASYIKEFDENNRLIQSTKVSTSIPNFYPLANTAYIILEEKTDYLNENEKLTTEVARTMIQRTSKEQYYIFKSLDINNRIIGIQVKFIFTK